MVIRIHNWNNYNNNTGGDNTVNFTIRTGDYLQDKQQEFIRLYNDHSITVPEIIKRLGISRSNYQSLRKQCGEAGLIKYRNDWNAQKRLKRVPKCIHKSTTKGIVYFQIKKGGVYYCAVKDYRDAVEIVQMLDKHGWNKDLVNEIKEEVCNV